MGYCCVCGRCWRYVSVSNSLLFTVTDFCAGRTSQTHGSDLSDDLSFPDVLVLDIVVPIASLIGRPYGL
jgi:hypothetical protein